MSSQMSESERNTIQSDDIRKSDEEQSKMIAKGVYGCIYYPAMSCNGVMEDSDKYVTKVQIDDQYSKNEIDISEKVKKIPFYDYHFAPILSSCSLKLSEIDKGIIKECHNVITGKQSRYIYMKIKHIDGGTLFDHLSDVMKESGQAASTSRGVNRPAPAATARVPAAMPACRRVRRLFNIHYAPFV